MEGIPSKQYGLILPKKNEPVSIPTKPSIFNDSDSDNESPGDWMEKTLGKEKYGGGRSKHSKAEIEKILQEDPTIYEYDEIYDDIQKKRNEAAAVKQTEKIERKPKYIEKLLITAEKRKRENERRIARQVQKEREAEGTEFADKEVFVTAAYKKKLEEMKAAEEEEKRQDRLESIGDVTKQGDLSGFYRHLYEKVVLDVEDEVEVPKSKKRVKKESVRHYRKRKSSESADEEPNEGSTTKQHNLTSELLKTEEGEPIDALSKDIEINKTGTDDLIPSIIPQSDNDGDLNSETEKNIKQEPNERETSKDIEEEEENSEPPTPKISIWEKRTVGEIFDSALQRYYERKASRLATIEC